MPFSYFHHLWLLLFADLSYFGETAGMEATAGRRVKGAGHRAFQDNPLCAGGSIHSGDGSQQGLSVGVSGLAE